MNTHRGALTPDNLSSLCNQAQLADVDLYDRSLCDDAQRGVEGGGRVLLHPEDGKAERGLQLRMRDVSFLKTQTLEAEYRAGGRF